MNDDVDNRSVPQLLAALTADLRLLLTETVGLARAEVQASTSALAMSIAGIAAGAVVLLMGVLVLVAALVLIAVALGLPPWAAALLVGVLLSGVGALTISGFLAKLKLVKYNLEETRRSVTETLACLLYTSPSPRDS